MNRFFFLTSFINQIGEKYSKLDYFHAFSKLIYIPESRSFLKQIIFVQVIFRGLDMNKAFNLYSWSFFPVVDGLLYEMSLFVVMYFLNFGL